LSNFSITNRISKLLRDTNKLFWGFILLIHPRFLSLTLGGRKHKTELDDRRLTLCYAKVGGTKALTSRISQIIGVATSAYKELEMQGMQLHPQTTFWGAKLIRFGKI